MFSLYYVNLKFKLFPILVSRTLFTPILATLLHSRYNAVGRSAGLEELGGMQLHLVLCLFLSWLFVVLAVLKGAKTLGKVKPDVSNNQHSLYLKFNNTTERLVDILTERYVFCDKFP